MDSAIHLTEEQMVRLLDGELTGRALARAEQHLACCADCARRKEALAEADVRVGTMLNEPIHFDSAGLRTRLRTSMLSAAQEGDGHGVFAWRRRMVPVVAAPVLTLVVAGVFLLHAQRTALARGRAEPDKRLTPGAVRVVDVASLCGQQDADFDPELPAPVRRAVFRKYGMDEGPKGEYQVDYLVSPQLGGTDAIENLWPEPYETTRWNAHAKDALERRLHTMVCAGELDLASAQQAVRVDWIDSYRKYIDPADPR